ncbi:hypothetical protein CANTEDRAFT_119827 [Yamadazyma tenuis ATCC 10573]|uniref:Uncharacterized protein n=2 Tax=Candida tenuis TaxID=2315449 RepID=G3B0L4_CANTC|nr:uncharacterized protein CANTEDRAFT_119827 [Yamadazyma tenuis ATCC 10573]EGV65423.1 hypothetical protein CANTEDRAFT_119827 [Yamadazyma tenuis ATCC 10573]
MKKISTNRLTVEESISIQKLFYNILDWSTLADGENEDDFLLACEIWHASFSKLEPELTKLQELLVAKRDIFVHVMMNNRNYLAYEYLMKSLVDAHAQIPKKWCDVQAETFGFTKENGKTVFNTDKISAFLSDPANSKQSKRTLISSFLRIGIHNDRSDQTNLISQFIRFLMQTTDQHLLLTKNAHSSYRSALYALVDYYEREENSIEEIGGIFEQLFLRNSDVFYNFLSTMLKAASIRAPIQAKKYWAYKRQCSQASERDHITPDDLTSVMSALFSLRDFEGVSAISKNHPDHYHENQLSIFLKVSRAKNDWKMLQDQFEAMYGKGHLPYATHYSIVMNSLAALGEKTDIDRLFNQLKKRNITPTPSIWGALIKCRIVLNEFEEAQTIFEKYLEELSRTASSGGSTSSQTASIYRLMMSVKLKSPNKKEVLTFFESSLDRQRQEDVVIVDSKTVTKVIRYFEEAYAFKEVQYVREICEKLDIMDEDIYCSLIRAYSRFTQHEMADNLALEAHHKSITPLMSSRILKEQLKNYRHWFKNRDTKEEKWYIEARSEQIIKSVYRENTSKHDLQGLYVEVERYFSDTFQVGFAFRYLEKIKAIGTPREEAYIPLMKHFASKNKIQGYQKIIQLYKEMGSLGIKCSVHSFKFLMKAVLFVDQHVNQNFSRSEKLLESILMTNDFQFPGSNSRLLEKEGGPTRTAKANIDHVATGLCQVVSDYLRETPGSQAEKAEFLVDFLSQLRERLDHKMKLQVRLSVYLEMGKLYQRFGNLQAASSLISNGIAELNTFIERYIEEYPVPHDYNFEVVIPRSIMRNYRTLMYLHIQVLRQNRSSPEAYLEIAKNCERNNIRLNGQDNNIIVEELMKMEKFKAFDNIFFITENFLAAGNLNEVSLQRHLQTLYTLFMREKCKVTSTSRLKSTYSILNDFYNIGDLEQLKKGSRENTSGRSQFVSALKSFGKRFSDVGDYDINYVMKNPEIFFSPEKRLTSVNKLQPIISILLFRYLKGYTRMNKQKLFLLMDKYPESIECLFLSQASKFRTETFRARINRIISPPADKIESFLERRIRTRRALRRIFKSDDDMDRDTDRDAQLDDHIDDYEYQQNTTDQNHFM